MKRSRKTRDTQVVDPEDTPPARRGEREPVEEREGYEPGTPRRRPRTDTLVENVVRGEYTSDGAHHGKGRGRVVAVKDDTTSGKRVTNPQSPAEEILIEWGTVENKRGEGYGWLPIIWINGRHRGDTWAAKGYDLDDAEELAKREAEEEASRYVGDFDVTVKKKDRYSPPAYDERGFLKANPEIQKHYIPLSELSKHEIAKLSRAAFSQAEWSTLDEKTKREIMTRTIAQALDYILGEFRLDESGTIYGDMWDEAFAHVQLEFEEGRGYNEQALRSAAIDEAPEMFEQLSTLEWDNAWINGLNYRHRHF